MKRTVLIVLFAVVSTIPMNAEIITFVDSNVKAICVANWDKDGDGELSTEEAAAVQALGEVFRGKTNIGSFPELKFFTGLTAIDEYAFSGSSIGPEIVVPGNVKSLEAFCFNNCQQLRRVILEEGVEVVGFDAFFGPVTFLSLPASLTYIASTAINPYIDANPGTNIVVPEGDLTVLVHTKEPASIDYYAFYYLFGEGHLVVPQGSKDAYKTAKAWSHFGEYLELGDVNRDGRLDIADVTLLIAFIQGREHTETEARIADVDGDGVLDGKDVELLCQYLLGS